MTDAEMIVEAIDGLRSAIDIVGLSVVIILAALAFVLSRRRK